MLIINDGHAHVAIHGCFKITLTGGISFWHCQDKLIIYRGISLWHCQDKLISLNI